MCRAGFPLIILNNREYWPLANTARLLKTPEYDRLKINCEILLSIGFDCSICIAGFSAQSGSRRFSPKSIGLERGNQRNIIDRKIAWRYKGSSIWREVKCRNQRNHKTGGRENSWRLTGRAADFPNP